MTSTDHLDAGATEELSAPLLLNPEALLLCGLMWAYSDHPTSSTVCEVLTANDFYDEVTVVDIMQEVADQDPGPTLQQHRWEDYREMCVVETDTILGWPCSRHGYPSAADTLRCTYPPIL